MMQNPNISQGFGNSHKSESAILQTSRLPSGLCYNHVMSGRGEHLFLYAICTLIWGSTWFVITMQVDAASPVSSVFWRFSLAAAILLIYCFIKKQSFRFSWHQHLLFAGMGTTLFSLNYILNYFAETVISSGLVALTFTSLIYFNIFGMRILFAKKITPAVILGASMGGVGILLIFLNEILNFDPNSSTVLGLMYGAGATVAASVGNMVAYKNSLLKVPVLTSNFYGMLYGSCFTFLIALATGDSLQLPLTPRFLGALVYLALFGSVIAFGAYLSLVGKIGAEKAGYTSVISPVLALVISSFFENFAWTPSIVAGVLLCLAGNFVTLFKKSSRALD